MEVIREIKNEPLRHLKTQSRDRIFSRKNIHMASRSWKDLLALSTHFCWSTCVELVLVVLLPFISGWMILGYVRVNLPGLVFSPSFSSIQSCVVTGESKLKRYRQKHLQFHWLKLLGNCIAQKQGKGEN